MDFLQYFSCRTHLLTDVYSLLADLIEWSDKYLFSKRNDDDRYRKIVKDLIQAVKVGQKLPFERREFLRLDLHFFFDTNTFGFDTKFPIDQFS